MSTNGAVRWGLLSTARITRRLVPAMRAVQRSAVTAVASRVRSRAEAFASQWHIPAAVEGYDALLARGDVDAVYVALPNSLHAEWTLKAIAAGKHVLCEKPFVTEPADLDRIQAAARGAGVVVEEGFMYRHEPMTAMVHAMVSDGAVGALRAVVSGFTYARNRPDDVRLVPELGGGALLDVGCYPVSYACLLAGSDATAAVAMAPMAKDGVDQEFSGVLRFRGDRMASIYAGFQAAYHTWLEVIGSEGSLSVPNPFKPGPVETLIHERLGERRQVAAAGSEMPFVNQIGHFVASVLDGCPVTVTIDESRRVAHALRLLASASGTSGAPS